MCSVSIRKREYRGWKNCLELANGSVKCIVTTDIGPRVVFYGFMDGENEFYEAEADMGKTGGDQYRSYAGHRLWHGPQVEPRCCLPDNEPVEYQETGNGVLLTQKVEPGSGIQKFMEISLSEDGTEVTVRHRMKNCGMWSVELTIWALTMMKAGGIEYIPHGQRQTGLLHNRTISLWPWTKMDDERLEWGSGYITLRQDPDAPEVIPEKNYQNAVKIGTNNDEGYAAYFNQGHLFIKKFSVLEGRTYPDGGCSYETYTDRYMLEMESLSPLLQLAPGETAEHTECWQLFAGVERPRSQEEAKEVLQKILG